MCKRQNTKQTAQTGGVGTGQYDNLSIYDPDPSAHTSHCTSHPPGGRARGPQTHEPRSSVSKLGQETKKHAASPTYPLCHVTHPSRESLLSPNHCKLIICRSEASTPISPCRRPCHQHHLCHRHHLPSPLAPSAQARGSWRSSRVWPLQGTAAAGSRESVSFGRVAAPILS